MKLKRAEWIAVAITTAFLLLTLGIRIGSGRESVPVTVQIAQRAAETAVPEQSAVRTETAPVDLNTASQEELETLAGIGPVLAQRITEYREEHGPFASVEDITRVRGIAEKVYEENRGRMCVE